jgi:ABC-type molybdate transport system substrate-binding protein
MTTPVLRLAALAIAAVATAMPVPAPAAEPLRLYAAGSLRGVMTDVIAAWTKGGGVPVVAEFGASGLLRDRIGRGERADVFASANMEHPQSLAAQGKAGAVVLFARNRMCALAAPGARVTTDTVLERMLDPEVKLGTSTPKADPSGDYAWVVFEKAERLRPGAFATLSAKARQLTGGPASPPPPDRSVYGMLVAEGKADLFLTYCTNAAVAAKEVPALAIVELPQGLAVAADYGLTVVAGAAPDAQPFARFVVSPEAQRVVAAHGFSPVTSP